MKCCCCGINFVTLDSESQSDCFISGRELLLISLYITVLFVIVPKY